MVVWQNDTLRNQNTDLHSSVVEKSVISVPKFRYCFHEKRNDFRIRLHQIIYLKRIREGRDFPSRDINWLVCCQSKFREKREKKRRKKKKKKKIKKFENVLIKHRSFPSLLTD